MSNQLIREFLRHYNLSSDPRVREVTLRISKGESIQDLRYTIGGTGTRSSRPEDRMVLWLIQALTGPVNGSSFQGLKEHLRGLRTPNPRRVNRRNNHSRK